MRRAHAIVLDADTRKELAQLIGSRSKPFRLAQRSRIVLLAAEGLNNEAIGAHLSITRQKAGRWRTRFAERGLDGILQEAPRSGRPPLIGSSRRAAIVRTTLDEKPANATQWSRTLMSAKAGVSPSTVGRIWKVHGLKPHLIRTFKLSNDKQFAEKLEDVVGLYLNPPVISPNAGFVRACSAQSMNWSRPLPITSRITTRTQSRSSGLPQPRTSWRKSNAPA